MDAKAEYLIKVEDFPKLLSSLLKEKVVDKILSAETKVNAKTNLEDRFTVVPKVVEKAEDMKDFPLSNLIAYGYARTDSAAKYLHKSLDGANKEKIGIIARPCDTRAVVELVKIKQINLDNVFIIAIEDRGMIPKAGRDIKKIKDVDPTKVVKEKIGDNGLIVKLEDGSKKELDLAIAENCLRCVRKLPVIADLSITDLGIPIDSDEIILKVYSDKGDEALEKSGISKKTLSGDAHVKKYNEIVEKAKAKRTKDLEDWANTPQEEKIARLQKCTMCNMCIRGCPVCYCVDCILQKKRKEKIINKETYQLTRIAHVADRCVECGNCANNCPQNLPLSLYFQSLNEAFKEKFRYAPGESVEDTPFRSAKAISEMELEKV